jgi:pimeloyl-ACP methyl ester carboxylesterase
VGVAAAGLALAGTNGSSDAMYNGYISGSLNQTGTLTVINLPAGAYDVYAYSYDGNFSLSAGGAAQGSITTAYNKPPVNPPPWVPGLHYARWPGVLLSSGDSPVLTVQPGLHNGYPVICGLQIAELDPSGNGLPVWWEEQYLNTNGVNPYAQCPSVDGWTILQAYQNGWNPNSTYTPPPPQNVVASLSAGGTNVTVTWTSGGGPVQGYAIQTGLPGAGYVEGQVANNVFSFTGSTNEMSLFRTYFVTAYFTNGGHADSQATTVYAPALNPIVAIVRGPSGQPYLVVGPVPPGMTRINLGWGTASVNIYPTNLANGIAQLPLSQMPGFNPEYPLQAQCFGINGAFGPITYPAWGTAENWFASQASQFAFVDARPHMKEDLKFLLRSATLNHPFSYDSDLSTAVGQGTEGLPADQSSPETFYARAQSPTGYEYYGFHIFCPDLSYAVIQELRPVQENYLWRNFAFCLTNYSSTWLITNGLFGIGGGLGSTDITSRVLESPIASQISGPLNGSIPLAMSSTNSTWLYGAEINNGDFAYDSAEVGMQLATNGTEIDAVLPANILNCYGLPFESLQMVDEGEPYFPTLLPNTPLLAYSAGVYQWADGVNVYANCAVPALQTAGYYFVSQTPYLSAVGNGNPLASGPIPPIPGSPTFTVTNTSPVLITALGQPLTVSGWAKMSVNGSNTKYAYLEQYFTNALTIDANGNVTTNTAGVLSPYGEFFPTVAGQAALVTMPDVDTGQRGTGVVNVIKLQLDVNHDGIMDLSFAGPDNTSASQPFVFWINNDFDRLWWDADDSTSYDDSVTAAQGGNVPDCNYMNSIGQRTIPTQRDLEDYARLWVVGVAQAIGGLPPGVSVSLSWGDVGSPNPANPTIDLFVAADPEGGIGYLTNQTTAAQQLGAQYVGRLGPGQKLELTVGGFVNLLASQYFIWCGVTNGTGQLTLTISQGGTNVLAQTSAYIQLQDIKLMYERWTVGENPNLAPTNVAYLAEEDLPAGTMPFQYSTCGAANTPYILFVHGWNMPRWEKDRFAERAFKRLYWQGYQGRFGSFRWPTSYGFTGSYWQLLTDTYNYNNGEFNAWSSAAGLLNKLKSLNAAYPGQVYLLGHSMGNVVAGESLRLAGSSQIVNTYVASQAAIPAHVYDSTVSSLLQFQYQYPSGLLSLLGQVNYGPNTPNIYSNRLAGNAAAAATRVSFYNLADWALAMPRWGFDQVIKPDNSVMEAGTNWNYAYNGSTNDPPPWNNFSKWAIVLPGPRDTVGFDIVNVIANLYEVMSYAAQSYSAPMGATPSIGGIANVNLQAVWPGDPTGKGYVEHFWHSAEFRGDNWQQQTYWSELLGTPAFNLK